MAPAKTSNEVMDDVFSESILGTVSRDFKAKYGIELDASLEPSDSLRSRIYREFRKQTMTVIEAKRVKSILSQSGPKAMELVSLPGGLLISHGIVPSPSSGGRQADFEARQVSQAAEFSQQVAGSQIVQGSASTSSPQKRIVPAILLLFLICGRGRRPVFWKLQRVALRQPRKQRFRLRMRESALGCNWITSGLRHKRLAN